jgi:hypothetical protein
MADLDALLGPKKNKDKTAAYGVITIGANNLFAQTEPKLPLPPKEKEEAHEEVANVAPLPPPKKQMLLTGVVSVRKETDADKAKRLEDRKRAREEVEAKKALLVSDAERERQEKLDQELVEATAFVEEMYLQKQVSLDWLFFFCQRFRKKIFLFDDRWSESDVEPRLHATLSR